MNNALTIYDFILSYIKQTPTETKMSERRPIWFLDGVNVMDVIAFCFRGSTYQDKEI